MARIDKCRINSMATYYTCQVPALTFKRQNEHFRASDEDRKRRGRVVVWVLVTGGEWCVADTYCLPFTSGKIARVWHKQWEQKQENNHLHYCHHCHYCHPSPPPSIQTSSRTNPSKRPDDGQTHLHPPRPQLALQTHFPPYRHPHALYPASPHILLPWNPQYSSRHPHRS